MYHPLPSNPPPDIMMTGEEIMSNTQLENILNFVPYDNLPDTSGQPKAEEFALIAAAGYQTVINLATPASPNAVANEAEIVKQAGMTYIPIPVIWENPRVEQFEQYVQTLNALKDRKVYLHCALNWRASCFTFLYRVIYCQINAEQAWWDLKSVWEPDETWNKFIRDVLRQASITDFNFML
jgi:protein tyrosine phosphatase (PTP) superfamily phosphohydrolase (DUF442 family)